MELSEPHESVLTTRRTCRLCGLLAAGRICDQCGIDLETGDLVAEPVRREKPKQARVAPPPRETLDLLRRVSQEAIRGPIGSAVIFVFVSGFMAVGLWPLVVYMLGLVMVERARAAHGSPWIYADRPDPDEELPELVRDKLGLGKPAAPTETAPAPDEDDDGFRPLERWDFVVAGLQGLALTLFVALPLVSALFDAEALAWFQSAGLLQGAVTLRIAQWSLLGGAFVMSSLLLLALRASGRAPTLSKRLPSATRDGPFALEELPGSVFKGTILLVPLALAVQSPWALLLAAPALPLLTLASSGDLEDLTPASLSQSWRLTPLYWRIALLSLVPIGLTLLPLALAGTLPKAFLWAPPVCLIGATLSGVLAGAAGVERDRAIIGVPVPSAEGEAAALDSPPGQVGEAAPWPLIAPEQLHQPPRREELGPLELPE